MRISTSLALSILLVSGTPLAAQTVVADVIPGVPTDNTDTVPLAPPAAVTYDNTAMIKLMSAYRLNDYGVSASDKPGIAIDLAHSWDGWMHWTLDWWQRYGFDGHPYGTTYASEHDLTITGDKEVQTRFCKLNIELSAAYYGLAQFKSMKDDVMEFYAEAACAFDLGWTTVSPGIRPMQVVGMGVLPSDTLVRLRLPFTGTFPFLWNAHYALEPSVTFNMTGNAGHSATFRPSGSLSWNLSDRTSIFVGAETTNHTGSEFELGVVFKF